MAMLLEMVMKQAALFGALFPRPLNGNAFLFDLLKNARVQDA
jgi:hypothetical protein